MYEPKSTKGNLTKQRILHIARSLFYRQGYDCTSTAQIAKQADISEAAMYKYFKNKHDLLLATVQPSILFNRPKEELISLTNDELIQLWTSDLLEKIFANRPQFTILFTEAVRHPELSEQYTTSLYELTHGDHEILRRMKQGRIMEIDLKLLQVGIIGATLSMVQHTFIYNPETEFTHVPEHIKKTIFQLIQGELLKKEQEKLQ